MTPIYSDHALTYWQAGWRGVLPLPRGEKGYPPKGYTGSHGVDPSYADVLTWVEHRPADANIALRCPDGVVGIDVDVYDGKRGDVTVAEHEARLGPLPPTMVSSARPAPSGIRWFRVPEGLRFRTVLGAGVEIIQRRHRYGVAPPSVNPHAGGAVYRWVDERTGEVLEGRVPEVDDLPELPAAWVDDLVDDGADEVPGVDLNYGQARDWVLDAPDGPPCTAMTNKLEGWVARLGSGEARHDVARDGSLALVRLAEYGHRGLTDALEALRGAFTAAIAGDRDVAREWREMVVGAVGKVQATPTPDGERGCRCGDEPTPVTTLPDVEAGDRSVDTDPGVDPYPALDWHALWDAGVDDVDWVVDGLVEAGRAAAIYAPGKTGKSLVLLELAAAVASGRPFAGLDVPRPRVVVYIDMEMSPGDVIERCKMLGYTPGDLARLRYYSLPMLPALDTDAGGQHLEWIVQRDGADLVVIDTVARSVAGPEDEADTFRDYYRHTGQRLKAAGVAVWRADHAGKDATKGQRGSSAKADDVDAVWKLTAHGHGRLALKCDRRRTMHGLDALTLERTDAGTLRRTDGPTVQYQEHLDEIVAALDAADVPLDWGRDRAAKAIRARGVGVRNEIVAAALSMRRQRDGDDAEAVAAPVPEPVPDDEAGDRSRGQVDPVPEATGGSPENPCPHRLGTGGDRSIEANGGAPVPATPRPYGARGRDRSTTPNPDTGGRADDEGAEPDANARMAAQAARMKAKLDAQLGGGA
ncbi:MAG: AAA family ATPase [Egibacteraceae bacterium]